MDLQSFNNKKITFLMIKCKLRMELKSELFIEILMNRNTLPRIQASKTSAKMKLGLDPAGIVQLMQTRQTATLQRLAHYIHVML